MHAGTGSPDALMVVAQAEGGPDRLAAGLKVFLVPTDAHGLSRAEISVEVTSPELQYALFFDEVRVPADAIVGAQDGLAVLFTGLNPERISSAALLNGIARYAIDKAVEYARTRIVWNAPIGAHQAISHPLARAETMLAGSRLLTGERVAAAQLSGVGAARVVPRDQLEATALAAAEAIASLDPSLVGLARSTWGAGEREAVARAYENEIEGFLESTWAS